MRAGKASGRRATALLVWLAKPAAREQTRKMNRELPYRLSAPLRFDFDSTASKADPFPFFASLREAGPVIPVKLPFVGKVWVTTTHEATSAMVKDNALFVQEARHTGKSGVAGMAWWLPASLKLLTNNMLLKDEPDHRRLRKLVDQAFQRRRVRDMRGEVEQIADRLLDGFEAGEDIDLVTAFSRHLPLEVICVLLGLPRQDSDVFSVWAKTATSMRSSFGMFRAFLSMRGVVDYVRGQIEECRLHPREGVISELVRAEEDGDKLSEDELISMVFLLLFAGFETTTHLISDSVIALEQNPAQKAYLLADPESRMERAVEELARYTTPVQSTKPRYASRDCEFFGQPLKRGDIVMGLLAGALHAAFRVGKEIRLLSRVLLKRDDAVADQVRGGLKPGEQQQKDHGDQLVFTQLVAVLFRAHQLADHPFARMKPAFLDLLAHIVDHAAHGKKGTEHPEAAPHGRRGLRPDREHVAVLTRQAEKYADHLKRQAARERVHKVYVFAGLEAVEEAVGDLLDLAAHVAHAPPLKRLIHQLAQAPVIGLVLEQHVVGEKLERRRQPPGHAGHTRLAGMPRLLHEQRVVLHHRRGGLVGRRDPDLADEGQLHGNDGPRLPQACEEGERVGLARRAIEIEAQRRAQAIREFAIHLASLLPRRRLCQPNQEGCSAPAACLPRPHPRSSSCDSKGPSPRDLVGPMQNVISAFPALCYCAALVLGFLDVDQPFGRAALTPLLQWMLSLGLGLPSLWAALSHAVAEHRVAQSIGWAPSPFQKEIAGACLLY